MAQWSDLTPMTNWDDIKVGEEYHIPPYGTFPSMDIKIIRKTDREAYFKQSDGLGITNTMGKYSTMAKILVKNKLKQKR